MVLVDGGGKGRGGDEEVIVQEEWVDVWVLVGEYIMEGVGMKRLRVHIQFTTTSMIYKNLSLFNAGSGIVAPHR